jgi:hypothetical protein
MPLGSWMSRQSQGGADELQGVTIALHHQIRDAPQVGVAEQDRAGVWIEQKLHPLELSAQVP